MNKRRKISSDTDHESKAQEILALAANLPREYRDKLVQDIKQLADSCKSDQRSGAAERSVCKTSVETQVTSNVGTIRKSSRQCKKTEKGLAFESQKPKVKQSPNLASPQKRKLEVEKHDNSGHSELRSSPPKENEVSSERQSASKHPKSHPPKRCKPRQAVARASSLQSTRQCGNANEAAEDTNQSKKTENTYDACVQHAAGKETLGDDCDLRSDKVAKTISNDSHEPSKKIPNHVNSVTSSEKLSDDTCINFLETGIAPKSAVPAHTLSQYDISFTIVNHPEILSDVKEENNVTDSNVDNENSAITDNDKREILDSDNVINALSCEDVEGYVRAEDGNETTMNKDKSKSCDLVPKSDTCEVSETPNIENVIEANSYPKDEGCIQCENGSENSIKMVKSELCDLSSKSDACEILETTHSENIMDANSSENVEVFDQSENGSENYNMDKCKPSDLVPNSDADELLEAPSNGNVMDVNSFETVEGHEEGDKDSNLTNEINIKRSDLISNPNSDSAQQVINGETCADDEVVPKRKRRPKGSCLVSSHPCPECSIVWPTRDTLRKHIMQKHKGSFKCQYCGQCFSYKHAHEAHERKHEEGNIQKCPHCANVIIGKDRLAKHIKLTHEDRINTKKAYHKCLECDEMFRSQKKLCQHQTSVHGKHLIQCGICDRRFFYKGHFDVHMKEHKDNVLKRCEHDECKFHYKIEAEYQKHVARTHEKNAPKPYMCHVCSRAFTEPRYLKTHIQCHKRSRKFVCETCMFETYTIQSLKAHLQRKHSMTLAHVCDICGAKLSSKVGLEDHIRRHFDQKDHVCPECKKCFVSKGQLSSHRKTHEKHQFACDTCQKTFVNKFKLAAHQKIHSKVKDFACQYCSYACNLKSNLYKHTERVHRVKHPDKFANYKYVDKVQSDSVTLSNETLLELVHIEQKTDEGEAQEEFVVAQEVPGNDVAVGEEQAEAAAVLAQMQTTPIFIKPEDTQEQDGYDVNQVQHVVVDGPPQEDPGSLPAEYVEIVKDEVHAIGENEGDVTCATEEVVVDSVDNVLHLVNENYQQSENGAVYMLRLEGSDETFALNSQDMNSLTGANMMTVENGTVLIDSSGNVVEIVQESM